jgi:hypothetical protein
MANWRMVEEHNIIQMLTQKLVEVSNVWGFDFFAKTLTLKNANSNFLPFLFYNFLGILVFLGQKGKKVNFSMASAIYGEICLTKLRI